MSHHPGGHGIGKSDVDGANGPGMAKVIGSKGNVIPPELLCNTPSNLLECGLAKIGANRREGASVGGETRQVEAIHPLRMEGPNLMLTGFGCGKNADDPVSSIRQS
jgi:hypothetical protein